MLETDQKSASLDSNAPSTKSNKDASYTIWFGPKAPEGHEGNWIVRSRIARGQTAGCCSAPLPTWGVDVHDGRGERVHFSGELTFHEVGQ